MLMHEIISGDAFRVYIFLERSGVPLHKIVEEKVKCTTHTHTHELNNARAPVSQWVCCASGRAVDATMWISPIFANPKSFLGAESPRRQREPHRHHKSHVAQISAPGDQVIYGEDSSTERGCVVLCVVRGGQGDCVCVCGCLCGLA